MEFDSVVRKRASVNSFKKKKTSWEDVIEAIDSAIQGPFSGNHNNLHFLIVEDPETIKQISKNCQQTWIQQSGLLIVVCSDETNLENMYGERGRVYSRQQAGAAINTVLLKLTDIGVNSCWVGSYTDELIKQILKIPQHIQIEAIIPTGFSAEKSAKPKKKKLESVLFWESWFTTKRPTIIKEAKDKLSFE